MQLIQGIQALKPEHKPSVVSIGNYDGVHLGHQSVIKTLLEHSKRLNAPSTVITFEPLAKEFFNRSSVLRLTSVEERANLLFDLGVDRVLVIDFNADFVSINAQNFVNDILIEGLGVQYLSVGDDFKFGKNRQGDFKLLKKMGSQYGFELARHQTFEIEKNRVSSGWVRQAVSEADFALAEKLLGRKYSITGIVSKGQQLGRTINYPTANIVLKNDIEMAAQGVYAVSAIFESGERHQGMANVGARPTVGGIENRLEVHLFDYADDCYGQTLKVEFEHKIRQEMKFGSVEELQAQIEKDEIVAKSFFE